MKLIINYNTGKLYQGFAQNVLDVLEPESIDCIICSPPYYALRSYTKETIQVFGGDKNCNHIWEKYNWGYDKKTLLQKNSPNMLCRSCGAILCQLGLEPNSDLYIQHLVMIFSEIKKILKKTGTCFINIGDSYDKNGNLLLIPYRLAHDLKKDGWFLKNIIIWNKKICFQTENKDWDTMGNGLPESTPLRFSKSYEVVLFLTKQQNGYYFNPSALKLGWKKSSINRLLRGVSNGHKYEKFLVYGTKRNIHNPRPHIKKYTGKLKSIAEQVSSIRARETRNERICDKINTGSISATTYRCYSKDEEDIKVQFISWLREQINNTDIEKDLDRIFGRHLWRNFIRQDRPGII